MGVGNVIAIFWTGCQSVYSSLHAPVNYRHISDEVESLDILINKATQNFEWSAPDNDSRQEDQRALKGPECTGGFEFSH